MMDLEMMELVSKALAALEAGNSNGAYFILKDAVSIYDERMENEYEVYSDAFQMREKAERKVTISPLSHPTVSLTPQANN